MDLPTGGITFVQLNYPSNVGHDAASIKWNEDGTGIGIIILRWDGLA
jgi:hypothetical protein